MQTALIVLSTSLLLTGPQLPTLPSSGAAPLSISQCLITLVEEVDVPAQQPGVLMELRTPILDANGLPVTQLVGGEAVPQYVEIREGLQVREGQLLGRIDDRQARVGQEVAQYKLKEAQIRAGNDISVLYADMSHQVARAEAAGIEEARRLVPGSITDSQWREAKLRETQAEFQITQSELEMELAEGAVKVQMAEVAAATLHIEHMRITAPFDGVVVERYVDPGEWVQAGQPVLRIVRIDLVQIEDFVDADDFLPSEFDRQPVEVTAISGKQATGLGAKNPKGKIVYVSPLVEAGNKFLVRAVVENVWVADPKEPNIGNWILRPGLHVDLNIQLRRVK